MVIVLILLSVSAVYLYILIRDRSAASGTGQQMATPTQPSQPPVAVDTGAVPTPIDSGAAAPGADAAPLADAAPRAADAAPRAADEASKAPAVDAGRGEEAALARTLVIKSNPSNVWVSINHKRPGRTPLTITSDEHDLSKRLYIQLSKRNYENWRTTIAPDDDRWGVGKNQRIELNAELVHHPDEDRPRRDGEGEQPDQPAEQPDQPAEQPDQPAEQPDQPAEQPDQPAEQPDQPAEQPDQPAEQPEPPTKQPPAEPSAEQQPPPTKQPAAEPEE